MKIAQRGEYLWMQNTPVIIQMAGRLYSRPKYFHSICLGAFISKPENRIGFTCFWVTCTETCTTPEEKEG